MVGGHEVGEVERVPAVVVDDDAAVCEVGAGVDGEAADVEGGEGTQPGVIATGSEPCIDGSGIGKKGGHGEADQRRSAAGAARGWKDEVAAGDGVGRRHFREWGAWI